MTAVSTAPRLEKPAGQGNLAQNLTDTAAAHPDAPALRLGDVTVDYAQLEDQAARVAAALSDRGVGVGDRVAMLLPNVLAFPALFYGILCAGAVAVPLNPLLKAGEVEYALRDCGAALLFAAAAVEGEAGAGAAAAGCAFEVVGEDGIAPFVAGVSPSNRVVQRDASDTAVILYTSGTTGRPKGAELTHEGLDSNQSLSRRTLINLGPDDVVMGCLPLFHVFGLTGRAQRGDRCGRLPDAAPALRAAGGAGTARGAPSDGLRGRAHDVLGAARGGRRRAGLLA